MPKRVLRTIPELEQELNDQLELLKLDVVNYDAGKEITAKSIATKLRVLLHDHNNSHSLLGQLAKKGMFHDTALEMDPSRLASYSGLISVSLSTKGAKYNPLLDRLPHGSDRQIAFEDWWNAVVFLDKDRNTLSRKDLVLTLADQDGGAHVDKRGLEEKYNNLTRQNSLNWQASTGEGIWKPLTNPHYAAIRQMAHEVLSSLIPGYTVPPAKSEEPGLMIAGVRLGIGEGTRSLPPSNPEAGKVGRNEPCPCGSGKKYKKCHG
jgi:hypothetical protein